MNHTHRVQLRYLSGPLAGLVITEITSVPRAPGRTSPACIPGDTHQVISVTPL